MVNPFYGGCNVSALNAKCALPSKKVNYNEFLTYTLLFFIEKEATFDVRRIKLDKFDFDTISQWGIKHAFF